MKLVVKKVTVTNPDIKEDVPCLFALCDIESGETLETFFNAEDANNKKYELENSEKNKK